MNLIIDVFVSELWGLYLLLWNIVNCIEHKFDYLLVCDLEYTYHIVIFQEIMLLLIY